VIYELFCYTKRCDRENGVFFYGVSLCGKKIHILQYEGQKVNKSRHLYTATYRETQTAAVYSTSSRLRDAVSGSPLPERTDFGPAVALNTSTYVSASRANGLHPAMLSGNDSLFLVASITGY